MKSHEDIDMKLYAFFNLTINGGRCAVLQTNYFISKEETQVPDKKVCQVKSHSEYYSKKHNFIHTRNQRSLHSILETSECSTEVLTT